MKKLLAKLALLAALVVATCALLVVCVNLVPPQMEQDYMAAFFDKRERLLSIEEPKIILVAGSNFAFGIDSALIEESLGMPAVNMGLHAGIGMSVPVEAAKPGINPGDIVILGFEYDLYDRPEPLDYPLVWSTLNDRYSLLPSIIQKDEYLDMAFSFNKYSVNKLMHLLGIISNDATTAYCRQAFNSHGDIAFPRPDNIIQNAPIPVTINADLIGEEVVRYLNDFAAYVRECGASVYITFPSILDSAVDNASDMDGFENELKKRLQIPIISDASAYSMSSEYFYDTTYHLTDRGAVVRTEKLIEDIRKAIE